MPYFYRNNIKYSGGSDSVDLTMAEYKELEANGKVVQDTTYYIIDADENIPSRPNLLINSNFANPVNQRGVIGDTWNKHVTYGLDRWKLYANGSGLNTNNYTIDTTKHKVSKNDGYITIFTKGGETYTQLAYSHEFPEQLKGKDITLSIKCRCTKDSYFTMNFTDTNVKTYVGTFKGTGNFEVYTLTANIVNGCGGLYFGTGNCNPETLVYTNLSIDTTLDVEWIKLELGDHATPYVPRLFEEEWLLCRRYYKFISAEVLTYYASANDMYFRVQYENIPNNGLRTTPTVTIADYGLLNGSTSLTGFNVVIANTYSSGCVITATKASHGISNKEHTFLRIYLNLDAELY